MNGSLGVPSLSAITRREDASRAAIAPPIKVRLVGIIVSSPLPGLLQWDRVFFIIIERVLS
jgi:hypothetical protein